LERLKDWQSKGERVKTNVSFLARSKACQAIGPHRPRRPATNFCVAFPRRGRKLTRNAFEDCSATLGYQVVSENRQQEKEQHRD
jgi:hypothetical protein